MCCFSLPIRHVSSTHIFARPLASGRQALIYAMTFSAAEELAMVLPLPTPPGSPDDALEFVDLSAYPRLFTDLSRGFGPIYGDVPASRGFSLPAPRLEVKRVGAFEASFVPTPADFERLDPRFRLPEGFWDALPGYRDYGFAVFKLRRTGGPLTRWLGLKREAHPMAFTFPTRDPSRLFFPTVHVHDGVAPERALFDHSLYAQLPAAPAAVDPHPDSWERSARVAGRYINADRAKGLVEPDAFCYRLALAHQMRENRDTWARAA